MALPRRSTPPPEEEVVVLAEPPAAADGPPATVLVATPRPNVAAAVRTSRQSGSGAEITGRITLKGTPPAEIPLPLDASCAKERRDKPTTRLYVVDASGGLADTFVYIKEGLAGKRFPLPEEPVVLDQKGCEYVPYVFGLRVGQTLLVRNSDNVPHNVHPTPQVRGNVESNKIQIPGAQPFAYTFYKPEIFLRFTCNVHGWMFAYAAVVDHPFFAVSGEGGTFKLPNVPPGKYVIEAYHRKAGHNTQEITVGEGDKIEIEFVFEVPPAETRPTSKTDSANLTRRLRTGSR